MKSIQVIVTGRARQLPGPRIYRSAGVAGVTVAKGSAAEKRDYSGRLRFVGLTAEGTSPDKIIDSFASDLSKSIPAFEARVEKRNRLCLGRADFLLVISKAS